MSYSTSNPIDDLIDQIDDDTTSNIANGCNRCFSQVSHLFKLSCNHQICLECAESLINENKYTNCPSCSSGLSKNLHKLYSEFMADPMGKLSHFYNINIGDMVWSYSGNGHEWLYSKDLCDQLNTAFEEYESDDEELNSTVEIQIQTGSTQQTYVVDFNDMVQYPKNFPSKRRTLNTFKLKSLSDIKKHKIIGVSGKLL